VPEPLLRHVAPGCRLVDRCLLPITISVSAGLLVPGFILGASWWNSLPDALLLLPITLSFLVAWRLELRSAVVGLAAIALALTGGQFSSLVLSTAVFAAPAWAIGRVMRSRTQLSVLLTERARELEREREAFADESVRYERTRIARDLHDVVAHNLSMIVVQAAAGNRTLDEHPDLAAETLRNIHVGARSAGVEIAQLVALLGDGGQSPDAGSGLRQLDELVRRAVASGLSVTYAFAGRRDRIGPDCAEVAYRVVQEGITNALKHAPGAAITVEVKASAGELCVAVDNAASQSGDDVPLAGAGGKFGLTGLRERINSVGGTLESGPTETGGWRLMASLRSEIRLGR
jgi:signal transduction histidine kinase